MLSRLALSAGLLLSASAFKLPQFSLEDLRSPSPTVVAWLQHAISDVGMFAVSGHPSLPEHRTALQELTTCVNGGLTAGHSNEVVLDDATLRTTVATATNGSVPQPFAEGLAEKCPRFVAAAAHLRAAAAATGDAYAQLLDRLGPRPLFSGPGSSAVADVPARLLSPSPSSSAEDAPPEGTFRHAVTAAESLEHFHVFRRLAGQGAPRAAPTLRMHSDMGLFLVMTPPQYYDLLSGAPVSAAHGFRLQLPDGRVVKPEFPPDSLLVMNGEGAAHWLKAPGADWLFAPPHEVVVPELEGLGRAWFGRMYLPHRPAVLRGGNVTFNQYWTQSHAAVLADDGSGVPAMGCSPQHRFLADSGSSCGAGQMYCWMTCMSISALTCPASQVTCKDPAKGTTWPDDYLNSAGEATHCFSCTVVCDASASAAGNTSNTTARAASGFCNSDLTAIVMWMTGFQTVGQSGDPCVLLFIKEWKLNNAGAFAGACIGVFLMSVWTESLVFARRYLKGRFAKSPSPRRTVLYARNGAIVLLYGLQVTMGYLLMLVAMTYQVELFIMVIIGLVVGHTLFNLKAPVAETTDACCQGQDAGDHPCCQAPSPGAAPAAAHSAE
eukprot:EG_transcript_5578